MLIYLLRSRYKRVQFGEGLYNVPDIIWIGRQYSNKDKMAVIFNYPSLLLL